jgi:hypothetical protein
MTLCEAYMGIDTHFDLWNYFFHVQCLQDPDAELTISRGAVIHIKSGNGADPYLHIPMPRSTKGWQKKWFYLRNDTSAPLPVFTGNRPIPRPTWGHGVDRRDLSKL